MSASRDTQKYRQLFDPKSAAMDFSVMAAAAALANFLFSPEDPGWMTLNPSPLLFVCILMGTRHGFRPGLLSGIFLSVVALASASHISRSDPLNIFDSHPYYFLALPAVGAVAGELHRLFAIKLTRLTITSEHTANKMRTLDTEFYLLRESKDELERMLASRDSELATLDSEIRRLNQSDDDLMFQNLLNLLSRQTRISDAAIYTINGSSLVRKALIGRTSGLPEKMNQDDYPIVERAILSLDVVSIPEIWDKPEQIRGGHLLAMPLMDFRRRPYGLLLVTGIPFMALNKRSVRSISLICRWVSEVLESRSEGGRNFRQYSPTGFQRIYFSPFFKEAFDLSFQTWHQFRLPCCLALLTSPGSGNEQQESIERLIMPALRTGDIPCLLELPQANLAILLQLTGERGGTLFVKRILGHCRQLGGDGELLQARLFSFDNYRTREEAWHAIHHPDHHPLLNPS